MKNRAWLLVLIALAGCQQVSLVDDVDLELDWARLLGPSDALHSPYVQGAKFALWIETAKKESLRGWHIDSADSQVIAVGAPALADDASRLWAAATTTNAGSVELRIVDDNGDVRHRHTVEVRFPDRVDVLPHGPLLINRPGVVSEDHPTVLSGGTATFLVQYFSNGERLSGHGALGAVGSSHIDAHVETSSFLEDRDWLAIDAQQAGVSEEIALQVGGQGARTLAVDTLDEKDIDHMKLSGESEAQASTKEWLVVLAEAFDAKQQPIHGVDFAFTANAVAQQGLGDLYRYRFAKNLPVMLEATHGVHADGRMIHSSGGFVDSTNNIGCSDVPGRAPMGSAGGALLVAVALLYRRRARVA